MIKKISIIIPIFNEASNILVLIKEIQKYLNNKIEYEIIIVDDGSYDNAYNILEASFFGKKYYIVAT